MCVCVGGDLQNLQINTKVFEQEMVGVGGQGLFVVLALRFWVFFLRTTSKATNDNG